MQISELLKRDINQRVANEGVAKISDRGALQEEISEYVVTEAIEEHLKEFLAALFYSVERRDTPEASDAMAVWVSGFFGSGKSHFAKVLGHLLANDLVDREGQRTAIDLFLPHLDVLGRDADATVIKSYLHRVRHQLQVHTVALDIKSKQNLLLVQNQDSVAETLLLSFYESMGFAPHLHLARIEKSLVQAGRYQQFKDCYQQQFGQTWEQGREEHLVNPGRTAKVLQQVWSEAYATEDAWERALADAETRERLTAVGFADELVAYVDGQRKLHPQRVPLLVFVVDELQQFIGDNGGKIEEVRTIVEQLGNRGKGRIWFIATGQEKLDAVVARTGLRLEQLGKLNARFTDPLHMTSVDVQRVVSDRLLAKRETAGDALQDLYSHNSGFLAELTRLDTERQLPPLNESSFRQFYPFLPYQLGVAQDIFDSMRGFRVSGNERSMLRVTQGILRQMGASDVGTVVPFDMVFDQIENELRSDDLLGSHGVNAVLQSDEKLSGCDVSPTRILKVLWLIQRVNWIPRTSQVIAKLLVSQVGTDIPGFRAKVEKTLEILGSAGYVSLDEGTKAYKFLSSEEGEVEKALIDKQGWYGVGEAMRRAKELCKTKVFTRAKMGGEYRVLYGKCQSPFDYALSVDGEDLVTGGEIRVECYGPLVGAKDAEKAANQNLAQGTQCRTIWWFARGDTSKLLENRLKRLSALQWLITEPKHTQGRSPRYLKAVEEKREEAANLEEALVADLGRMFREGRTLYAGEESDLDGKADFRAIVREAFDTLVPNLYDRFTPANREYDARDIDRFMQPGTQKLDQVAASLSLFDATGQLLRQGALAESILEELKEREDGKKDGNNDLDGDALLGHFAGIPFGWPNDLVRLVFAGLFRGGAIAVVAGGKRLYDYTDAAAAKHITGVREFKKAQFVSVTEILPPSTIKAAREELGKLGVKNVQDSTNDLARAIRLQAAHMVREADSASGTAGAGLPLPDTYKKAETACKPLVDLDDPNAVVTGFLKQTGDWHALKEFFDTLHAYLSEGKDKDFRESQQFVTICTDNPVLHASDQATKAKAALDDMAVLVKNCEVISKWKTYWDNYYELFTAYRMVYQAAYQPLVKEIAALRSEVEKSPEWQELEDASRQHVVSQFFGPSGALCLSAQQEMTKRPDLLQATNRYSLVALENLRTALPAYRTQVWERVRQELAEQGTTPKVKIHRWSTAKLRGRSFTERKDLQAALAAVEAELGSKIDDDYTVIVE